MYIIKYIDGKEVNMEEWLETLDEYLYYEEADIEFQRRYRFKVKK